MATLSLKEVNTKVELTFGLLMPANTIRIPVVPYFSSSSQAYTNSGVKCHEMKRGGGKSENSIEI